MRMRFCTLEGSAAHGRVEACRWVGAGLHSRVEYRRIQDGAGSLTLRAMVLRQLEAGRALVKLNEAAGAANYFDFPLDSCAYGSCGIL